MATQSILNEPTAGGRTDPLARRAELYAAVSDTVRSLASLKFTVVLFAMMIVIIFTGTLAQHRKDIWQVVDQYFRCGIAWIEIQDLFPPSFFSWALNYDWGSFPIRSVPFPGGWMIGVLMGINLIAAHAIRFRVQASGPRLWSGLALIAIGTAATWLVIVSGANKDGVQSGTLLSYDGIWKLLLLTVLAGSVTMIVASLRTGAEQRSQKFVLGLGGLAAGAASIWAFTFGADIGRLDDSSMRIMWQLMKATFAGLVLLAGCFVVFRKRAGIVLLHGGVGLMMVSELLVGLFAVENQMRLREGETRSYIYDVRETELAVVDTSDSAEDRVIAIPESRYMGAGNDNARRITDDMLPFDIEVVEHFRNSDLRRATAEDTNRATAGAGLQWVAQESEPVTGLDSEIDVPSMYVSLREKGSDRELGTRLVSLFLSEGAMLMNRGNQPEQVEVNGSTYDLYLRFKRDYKPYAITLLDVRKDDYVGTETPRNYSSDIRLVDPTRNVDHEARIWMNNPLRFAGETFYQSGYQADPVSGQEYTTLAVVTNMGWMIPYVSCMIVAVGMLAQFLITLTRFLKRRARPLGSEGDEVSKLSPWTACRKFLRDLVRQPPTYWLRAEIIVPTLVIAFALGIFALIARVPNPTTDDFDLYRFGQIPIAYQGREKPIDTLARNSLRIVSDRQKFKDADGKSQPAIRWLLDVIARPDEAEKHPVFRVEDLELLSTLGLERRKRFRYSSEEIMEEREALVKQAELAHDVEDAKQLSRYQRKVLELERQLGVVALLQSAFQPSDFRTDHAHEDLLVAVRRNRALRSRTTPLAVPTGAEEESEAWDSLVMSGTRASLRRLAESADIGTSDKLAAWMMDQLPRETILSTVEVLLPLLRSRVGGSGDQTIQELAKEMAGNMSANPQEQYLRDISLMVSSAEVVDTPQTLVDSQSSDTIRNIFDLRLEESFLRMIRELPQDLVRPIEQEVRRSPGRPDKETINRYMTQLTEAAITDILGQDGLDNDEVLVAAKYEEQFQSVLSAWTSQDAGAFNSAVGAYLTSIQSDAPGSLDTEKIGFEAYFNYSSPFFIPIFLYLFAFVLAAVAWLGWSKPLNRASFALICLCLVVHTLALAGRIYISGRPPVTNLYSSAVFIGWGAVVLGLLLELVYRIGIGNMIAAFAGSATLGIAHLLAGDGDTFTVLQAVLDTQFWLATHVVCITLGYSTTFVAGLLGIAYILLGVLTPALDAGRRSDLVRMIYGILCFAIFFSFVGTVLGGLWADDSWGRFWGWDPKENGALIIVLWNALVLHARWGGLARDRGMAMLSVVGNIWTAWSWFGVNELGVGLHSYGFTEGVLFALGWFVVSQVLVASLVLIPKEKWWSFRASS